MEMFNALDSGDAGEVVRLLETDPTLLEAVLTAGWHCRGPPLVHAASREQMEMVKLLVAKGANLHATAPWGQGWTALHYAASRGHEGMVACLLENGASPFHQDSYGCTPLTLAVQKGRTGMALLLLKHMEGHGLEASTLHHARAALRLAVDIGHTELVTMLLDHGAQADSTDSEGKSVLQIAVCKHPLEMVKLLVKHLGPEALQERDRTGRDLLHFAAKWGCEEVVAYLLSQELVPYMQNNRGETALMYGARRYGSTVMRMLLKHMGGHGLDQRSEIGWTALHYAVDADNPWSMKALLLAGADPYIVDKAGRTPRVIANQKQCVNSIATFTWWDGGAECAPVLYQARVLHDAYTTHQGAPTRPVPGYLKARVEAGLALPQVEVVALQQEGAGWEGDRKRTRAATRVYAAGIHQDLPPMLGLVVGELSEELFTELMGGFMEWRSDG